MRPHLEAIAHRDQPRRDAQPGRCAAQRDRRDVIDLELPPDLARIGHADRAHEAGRAHANIAGRQRVDQIVEHAVGEVLVPVRARDRQHGERAMVDLRRGNRRRRGRRSSQLRRHRRRPDRHGRGGHRRGPRRDRVGDIARARGPPRRLDREAALDEPQELGRRMLRAQRAHLLRDLRDRDRDRVVALPRPCAGRELVEHDAEREQIRARVDLAAGELLGRHVARRSDHRADLRDVRIVEAARDAEIGDHHALRETVDRPLDEHVVRLEIAMHDPDRVRGREAFAQLHRDRQQAPPRHRARRELRERRALDQLHRQELHARVLADVEHARDVAVLDPPGQAHLAAKPFDRVVGQPVAQDLERDVLAELGVDRRVHAPHAAAAEPAHDAIAVRDQLGHGRGRQPAQRRQRARDRVVVTGGQAGRCYQVTIPRVRTACRPRGDSRSSADRRR